MQEALQRLEQLGARAARAGVGGHRQYNNGWHTALDLGNMLTISEEVARAALDRKESRGAHFRDDYPKKDEAAGKVTTVVRRGPDGAMQIIREPVREVPAALQAIIEEFK